MIETNDERERESGKSLVAARYDDVVFTIHSVNIPVY